MQFQAGLLSRKQSQYLECGKIQFQSDSSHFSRKKCISMQSAEGTKVHFCTTALSANQPTTTNVNRSV